MEIRWLFKKVTSNATAHPYNVFCVEIVCILARKSEYLIRSIIKIRSQRKIDILGQKE